MVTKDDHDKALKRIDSLEAIVKELRQAIDALKRQQAATQSAPVSTKQPTFHMQQPKNVASASHNPVSNAHPWQTTRQPETQTSHTRPPPTQQRQSNQPRKNEPPSQANTINAAVREFKEREKRSANIILAGVETTDDEDAETKIGEICKIVGVNSEGAKIHRLPPSANNNSAPSLIRVIFDDTKIAAAAKSGANKLQDSAYAGVFIRPDRTETESIEFAELNAKRKAANAKLGNRVKSPFLWVIRGTGLRCIDVTQSTPGKPHYVILPKS